MGMTVNGVSMFLLLVIAVELLVIYVKLCKVSGK